MCLAMCLAMCLKFPEFEAGCAYELYAYKKNGEQTDEPIDIAGENAAKMAHSAN